MTRTSRIVRQIVATYSDTIKWELEEVSLGGDELYNVEFEVDFDFTPGTDVYEEGYRNPYESEPPEITNIQPTAIKISGEDAPDRVPTPEEQVKLKDIFQEQVEEDEYFYEKAVESAKDLGR